MIINLAVGVFNVFIGVSAVALFAFDNSGLLMLGVANLVMGGINIVLYVYN